ncbi:MAG: hypothetical protein ACRCW4_14550 [Candidatus Neomicrothrix subdominans]
MADEPTTTPPGPATDPTSPPAPPADPTPAPEPDPTPAQLGDAGKRALDAERAARRQLEARLKELEPLAEQARKAEEGRKTAEQKLTEKLTAAETKATTAEVELMRFRAALAKAPQGLELAELEKMARRLTGATPEELEADAAELFALFTPPAPPPAAPSAGNGQRPVEQLRPGALPTQPQPTLVDQIVAAEKAGDTRLAMRLKSQQLMALQHNRT